MRKILVLIFIILLQSSVQFLTAQGRLPCGNGPINASALNTALTFEHSPNRVEQVDYLVRIYIHVFHDDDGSAGAASFAQIQTEFTSLLASYAATNICFLFAGIDSFNTTAINRNFNADSDPSGTALSSYQVPNCINVFYMRKINGNNTACSPPCGYGGIALGGIPGTFCLVSTGNIGPGNTIGHEVGHCLGLFHTFETANGFEKIDGSNSSTAADMITDTPADPFAYNGSACYSTDANACTYTGTCKDPNNQTNFSPPYTNLMAYWSLGNTSTCVVNPLATGGQFTRVRSFLNTYQPLMNCASPQNLPLTNLNVSSGYYMRSAINDLVTSGTVTFTLSVEATLGAGRVTLLPGFRAAPNSNGIIRILTKPCN